MFGYNPPLVLLRKRQLAGLGYLSGVIWICACGGGAADEAGDSGSTTVGLTAADLTTADLTTGDGPTDSTPTEAGEPFPGRLRKQLSMMQGIETVVKN